MKHFLLTCSFIVALAACSPSDSSSESTSTVAHSTSAAASAQAASSSDESILNYKEKLDVARLAMALQKAGLQNGQAKEAEWGRRMAAAKNNADMQAVFAEQLVMYREVENALQPLSMSSAQGKQIHVQMLRGFSGMRQVLEKIQSLNLDTPEGIVQINEMDGAIKNHGQDIMQSMMAMMAMMKANGFEPDAAKEAEFEQKVQELQQKLNQ